MPLSRQQIAEIFATDAERYKKKKEESLDQLGKTTPYAGLEKLTNIGVGAITGGLSGGLGGAVMGGISGSNADNPIQAGISGASMGTGLTDIIGSPSSVPQIPGGISGAVQDTMGKSGDIGQLIRPENFEKTSQLYKTMTGEQSGADMLGKLGTINKEAITKQEKKDQTQIDYDRKLDEAKTKRQNELDDAKTKREHEKELAKVKKSADGKKPKVDEANQKANYISAKNNIAKATKKYANDPIALSKYYEGIQGIADEMWQAGDLSNAQYNDIMKKINIEEL
jgi:hypothetical protein